MSSPLTCPPKSAEAREQLARGLDLLARRGAHSVTAAISFLVGTLVWPQFMQLSPK